MTTAAFSANLKPRLTALTAVKREHCAPPTYKPAQDIRGKMPNIQCEPSANPLPTKPN